VRTPPIGARDVLVEVHASSLAGHDPKLVRGESHLGRLVTGWRRPAHRVLGRDVAGRVGAVGTAVTGWRSPVFRVLGRDVAGRVGAVGTAVTEWRPGDDVFGWCGGAFAEHVAVPAAQLARKPPNLTFAQAAVVPVSGSIALRAVRDAGRVRAGQRVLVIGASGRVGTFAVQIAKALGATVTGVCSTTNTDLVRSIGADEVVDYTLHDVAAHGARYDVVIDLVGDRSIAGLRRLATRTGVVVLVSGPRYKADARRAVAARLLAPFVRQRIATVRPAERRSDLTALSGLIQARLLTPVVSAHFSLAEVPAAMRHFAPGHSRGTVAITV
jgi:NADPH:quinone reductase-like Zn-dependent oxidoreductase